MLGHIPAGIPVEAIEDVLDYEEAPLDWTTGGREYFALKIKGDSMSPNYIDGDTVIFLVAEDFPLGLRPDGDKKKEGSLLTKSSKAEMETIHVR